MTPEDLHRLEAVDFAIANSKSLDELVGFLENVAPQMAQAIEGKALVAARSPIGVLLFYIIGWTLCHGLGMNELTTAVVAGGFVLVGGYIMRIATRSPITGIFHTRPV